MTTPELSCDVLIIGSGAAGLSLALRLAEKHKVIVLSKGPVSEGSTFYAQGGIAAVFDETDSIASHVEDTLIAGAGICDRHAVEFVASNARTCVQWLIDQGVLFDTHVQPNGKESYHLTREGGHSHRRILHAGGASKVYQYTTNPDISSGDGIAMAWRAGCRVANLEFNQFHPTALYHPQARNFLLTEALRGEGAYLKRPDGSRFMPDVDERGELAPRDIVARAIDHEMKRLGADCMFLDISHKPDDFIRQHFPMIYAKLLDLGMDLTKEPIPVVPAAHYTCGGVVVDDYGRTDVDGLYAIGEVSYTGLHGANRMASNSLLECLVYGWSAAMDIDRRMPSVHSVDVLPAWDESRVENADERVVIQHNWHELRLLMWDYVGIVRTTKRLERALRRITMLQQEIDEYYANFRVSNNLLELRNLVQVAELIVRCAMMRKESRGLHFTLDYPQQLAESGPSILSPLTPHINR